MSGKEATEKLKRKEYEKQLHKLQEELCYLQDWIKETGERVIIILEGRDAAGKGGTIKAITERVSPRVFRVVALPAPSDREKSQMYMQRYVEHFPAAGEIVIFDRSWYNRAGVEYVMGFCSPKQHKRFLELCPIVEKFIIDGGIRLHQDLAGSRPGGAGAALPGPHRRSDPPVEAEPDGRRIVQALVRLFPGARHDARAHRHRCTRRGTSSIPTTRSAPGSTSSPTSCRRSPTRRSSTTRSSCRSGRQEEVR